MTDIDAARAPHIHLPAVSDLDRAEVLERIMAAARGLPAFTFQLSASEAHRVAGRLERGTGPLTHLDVLAVSAGVVETLFDDDVSQYSAAFRAQLIMMFQFPCVPELAVTQVAFGRAVGEEGHRTLGRVIAAAERSGMNVDDYVAELAPPDGVRHHRPVRLFLGESGRAPDAVRLRKAISLLRTTAASAPEPFRPQILCAIAWMLWARGKRPLALAYLAHASELDSALPLARGLARYFQARQPQWISGR